jgi:hypothetical protein
MNSLFLLAVPAALLGAMYLFEKSRPKPAPVRVRRGG